METIGKDKILVIFIKKILFISTFFCFILCLSSCKDNHWFDFLNSTGDIVTISRPIEGNFDTIELNDNVNLQLSIGSQYKLELEGGKNLLSGIETNVEDGILSIKNLNKFNWVRSYKPELTVFLTLPIISEIRFNSVGRLSNTDTIRQEYLKIVGNGGSGYVDMTVDISQLHTNLIRGAIDVILKGKAGVVYAFNDGLGTLRLYDLDNGITFITNKSPNNCFINTRHLVEYNIYNKGNIYVKGNPINVTGTSYGSGKLILVE